MFQKSLTKKMAKSLTKTSFMIHLDQEHHNLFWVYCKDRTNLGQKHEHQVPVAFKAKSRK